MLSVLDDIKTDGQSKGQGECLVSASLILCCLSRIGLDIAQDKAVSLLQLFTLQPDLETSQCPDLHILMGLLSKNQEMR